MIKNTNRVKIDRTFGSQAEISKKIYILKCLYCTNVFWCKIFFLINLI